LLGSARKSPTLILFIFNVVFLFSSSSSSLCHHRHHYYYYHYYYLFIFQFLFFLYLFFFPARRYTPIVVFGALLLATVPWAWGREVGSTWAYQALVLLVVACPCALVISTPIAYVSAITGAAKRGVLVKGGRHLETLNALSVLCLDKTGTITQGNFACQSLQVVASDKQWVLDALLSIESASSHPLAAALAAAAIRQGSVLQNYSNSNPNSNYNSNSNPNPNPN
jgi:magnesium-transporting ATPase (P-type)